MLKNKVKQLMCMVCVFVASFLVTVTAYAYIDVDYSIYGGKYKSYDESAPGYISISEENIRLVVYRDDPHNCFVSGTTTVGYVLYSPPKDFYALFSSVIKVNTDGSIKDADLGTSGIQIERIPDYEASGLLFTVMGIRGINPLQSDVNYFRI